MKSHGWTALIAIGAVSVAAAIGIESRRANVARSDVMSAVDAGLSDLQAGRFVQAESRLRPAVALARQRLGDVPDTARALNALGMLDKYTARFDEGAVLYRDALRIAERAPPFDAMLVADILHNLGGLEHARDRFADGEPWARRAVEVRARALGPGHVAVAADRAALAAILSDEGKRDEAEALLVDAIATFDRTYGPMHVDTAVALNNLGALYQARDDERAESTYKRALSMKEALLPANHPDIARTANNLAILYRRAGRLDEALALYRRALDIMERAFGPSHPATAAIRDNYKRALASK